jgi:hypothetical protein
MFVDFFRHGICSGVIGHDVPLKNFKKLFVKKIIYSCMMPTAGLFHLRTSKFLENLA